MRTADSSSNTRTRRTFLKHTLSAGLATAGLSMIDTNRVVAHQDDDDSHGSLTRGDAALLRFAAAAEILESDFWIQYNELGGVQDAGVPGGSGNAV